MNDTSKLPSTDFLTTFLNEVELEKISQFYNDPIMREGVKKMILAGLYKNGTLTPGKAAEPTRNAAFSLASSRGEFSNEALGADLRALWEGINALEVAFNQMAKFKIEVPTDTPKKVNRAK